MNDIDVMQLVVYLAFHVAGIVLNNTSDGHFIAENQDALPVTVNKEINTILDVKQVKANKDQPICK